jgi:PAS domain S-box-containing protein
MLTVLLHIASASLRILSGTRQFLLRQCACPASNHARAIQAVCEPLLPRHLPLVWLSLFIFACSPGSVKGDVHYEFQYFKGRSGHRVVEVADIAESANGVIWVATWGDGIHRIHNTDYKNYTTSSGLPTNWFRGIEHVKGETLWAHTRGIIPINGTQIDKPVLRQESSELPDNDFRTVHSLSDGRILAVTSDGDTLVFDSKNGIVDHNKWSVIATRKTFQEEDPIGFLELPTGDILASVNKRGLFQFDGTLWKSIWGERLSWVIRKTTYGGSTQIWAACKENGQVFRLKKNIWEKVTTAPVGITCFLPLPENKIFISSGKNIYQFSEGRWASIKWPPGIGSPTVNVIFRDANGIIWIGADEGLIRGLPRTWQSNFVTDDGVKLFALVRNRDEPSPLWYVDEKHRLVRFEDSRLHPFLQLKTTQVFDVGVFKFPGEKSVWGMSHKRLQKFSLSDGSLENEWPLKGEGHRLCKLGIAGHVVLTNRGAFTRGKEGWVEFPAVKGYQRKGVFDLFELKDGVVLAAVENGAELWKDDRIEKVKNAKHDFQSIHMNPNGRIWISGFGQGVMNFDGATVVQLGNSRATDNQLVSNVYESRDGTLWASLRRGGIASLRNDRWITYRFDHGLPNRGIDCIREDDQGIIWVSVLGGGVFSFQPDNSPPDTRIFDSSDDVASHGIASFSFSGWDAWDHTPRNRLVYSWRVISEPGGEVVLPWSNGSLETVAVTSALDPGRYRLEVRAADQDRNVDPTPAAFVFSVQLPIWRQPAYTTPIAGLSLLLFYASFLWYRARGRRRRTEFERAHLERYSEDLEVAVAERTTESVESEGRLRTLLEGAFEGIIISENGKMIDANHAFADMFGYAYDEINDLTYLDLTSPESVSVVKQNISSGVEKPYEIIALKKDGTKFDVELLGKNCLYRGHAARITAMRDITERKQAEMGLRRSEENFRRLTEAVPVGQSIIQDGRRVFANHWTENLSGVSREELMSMSPEELLDAEYHDQHKRMFQECSQRGISSRAEFRALDRNGRVLWVDYSVTPIEFNRKPAILVASFDITERKRAEEEARKHRDDLAHVSRISTMGEMATGIAHELNQPLTAVASYSFFANRMIEDLSIESHEIQELLTKLEDQAIRAGEILRR